MHFYGSTSKCVLLGLDASERPKPYPRFSEWEYLKRKAWNVHFGWSQVILMPSKVQKPPLLGRWNVHICNLNIEELQKPETEFFLIVPPFFWLGRFKSPSSSHTIFHTLSKWFFLAYIIVIHSYMILLYNSTFFLFRAFFFHSFTTVIAS